MVGTEPFEMRPTKVLAAKSNHYMLGVGIEFNATCCAVVSLIGLLSVAPFVSLRSPVLCVVSYRPPQIATQRTGERREMHAESLPHFRGQKFCRVAVSLNGHDSLDFLAVLFSRMHVHPLGFSNLGRLKSQSRYHSGKHWLAGG